MLSEMLGELNGSHTGARYNAPGASLKTAVLGLFLDNTYEGDGLRVEEVIKRGPFDVKKTGVTPGCIIEKIDGHNILAGEDYNWMLDGKAGKPIHVTVFNPTTKKRSDVTVKAISKGEQNELLYKRWVDRNRALVDSLSGGQLAYVHVKTCAPCSAASSTRNLCLMARWLVPTRSTSGPSLPAYSCARTTTATATASPLSIRNWVSANSSVPPCLAR